MFTSLLSNLNYYTVFLLMLMESTVLPVPSELVVAPAAFNAAEGDYNLWLIILVATLGADCGATINYLAGYYLGRPIIYAFANSKWGKMCLLNQKKVEQAEKYFDNQEHEASVNVKRKQKTFGAFERLPEEFTNEDVMRCFNLNSEASSRSRIRRLIADHLVEKVNDGRKSGAKQGLFRKTGLLML